jgi:hypothetical protein
MTTRTMSAVAMSALGAVLVSGTGALANVPWSNPNGTASFFSWANGGSATGLYGSPTLVGGDTFVFFPQEFRAQSNNGVAGTATDRLEVDLFAGPGFRFSAIQLQEFGDYGIETAGSVSCTGTLTINDLDNAVRTTGAAMTTNPGFPLVAPGTGNWDATAGADLGSLGPAWTRIHLVLENDLLAISIPGHGTYIEKSVLGSGVAMTILPAPGGLALLGLGALAAVRRRRA